MKCNLLELNDVNVNYYGGYSGCNGASFVLNHGEIVCVLGDKSSGKSSLLKGIAGLEPYTGNILLGGVELSSISMEGRNFGMTLPLPRRGSIRKALEYPLKLRKTPKADIAKKVLEVSDAFGISHLLDFGVSSLTPEQSAYAEAARLFMIDRKVYLIDNLLSNVYITERRMIFPKITEVIKSFGKAVIYATDLVEEAELLRANQNIYLSYNRMVDSGRLADVMKCCRDLSLAKYLNQDRLNTLAVDINEAGVYYCGTKVAGAVRLINNNFTKAIALLPPSCVKICLSGGIKGKVVNTMECQGKVMGVVETSQARLTVSLDGHAVAIGDEVQCLADFNNAIYYDYNSEMIITKR